MRGSTCASARPAVRSGWSELQPHPRRERASLKVIKFATDITAARCASRSHGTADCHRQEPGRHRIQARRHDHRRQRELSCRDGIFNGRDPRQTSRHLRAARLPRQPRVSCFLAKLKRGEFDAGQYLRIGKGGKEIWLEASYNPILDTTAALKVVKYAIDVTNQKNENRTILARQPGSSPASRRAI